MRAAATAGDRLVQLLESPLLPLLRGCAVSLSVVPGERPPWALRAARLAVAEGRTVPLVEVAVGDGGVSGAEALRAAYAIAHARRRCEAVNATAELTARCRLRLQEGFQQHSLARQIAAVRGVAQFVAEVQPEGSPAARMDVRLGAPGERARLRGGVLELPMHFTLEHVKAALLKH